MQDAARALTGWSVSQGQFREVAATHDAGVKCLFDKRGTWSGKDLITIVLDHPATAHRLARRICECFMGEGAVSADELRRWLMDYVGTPWISAGRSRRFSARGLSSTSAISRRVLWDLRSSSSARWRRSRSQTRARLHWPTGRRVGPGPVLPAQRRRLAWRSRLAGLRGLIARVNFAAAVADGRAIGCAGPFDALGLAGRHGCRHNPDELLGWFSRLLLGRELNAAARDRILAAVKPKPLPELGRSLAAMILTTPEAQLN